MNMLMLVVVALVALCYFGGNYCPAILKKNKEMLLGVAAGLVLCSFFGMRLEGIMVDDIDVFDGDSFQDCLATAPHGEAGDGKRRRCMNAYAMAVGASSSGGG